MKPCSVSVLLPARNAEETLPEAIQSIREQSFSDFELILVDHNSSDSTWEIIKDFAAKDPRVRACQQNGTFVEALNFSWEVSSGEFLARMDSDDMAHPDRLMRQVGLLREHLDLDACGSLVRILKRDLENHRTLPADEGYARYETWVNSVISHEEILMQRFIDSPIPNPTMMIRRSVMEQLGGYADPEWAEDYDFWLRFLEQGFRIGKVEKVLLDWYDSPNRSTRTIPRYELHQFQVAKAEYLSKLPMVQRNGASIWGAGPIGKEMARLLTACEIDIHQFVEVNQRQIGNRISGVPVIDWESPGAIEPGPVLLAAVGNREARELIRERAEALGRKEGEDFFCVA